MLSKTDQIAAGVIMGLLIIGCVLENWKDKRHGMANNGVTGLLWLVGAALASILLVAALYAPPAFSRNLDGRYDRSPNKEWFESQHNSAGGWCCNEADGHYYDGDYSFDKDGNVTLTLDGQKVQIEAFKVLKGPNPTGRAVVWYLPGNAGPMTLCFAPGQLT